MRQPHAAMSHSAQLMVSVDSAELLTGFVRRRSERISKTSWNRIESAYVFDWNIGSAHMANFP